MKCLNREEIIEVLNSRGWFPFDDDGFEYGKCVGRYFRNSKLHGDDIYTLESNGWLLNADIYDDTYEMSLNVNVNPPFLYDAFDRSSSFGITEYAKELTRENINRLLDAIETPITYATTVLEKVLEHQKLLRDNYDLFESYNMLESKGSIFDCSEKSTSSISYNYTHPKHIFGITFWTNFITLELSAPPIYDYDNRVITNRNDLSNYLAYISCPRTNDEMKQLIQTLNVDDCIQVIKTDYDDVVGEYMLSKPCKVVEVNGGDTDEPHGFITVVNPPSIEIFPQEYISEFNLDFTDRFYKI